MKERIKRGEGIAFTQVVNAVLNNPNLSMKAKGLYAYLYSKPGNWDFSSKRIEKDHKDGRDSVLSSLRELVEHGYLSRKKLKNGRTAHTIHLKPKTEKSTVGNVLRGKTPTVNNKEVYKQREERNNPLPPLKGGRKEISRQKLNHSLSIAQPYYKETGGNLDRIITRLEKSDDRFLRYVATYIAEQALRGNDPLWVKEEDYIATLTNNLKPVIEADLNVSFDAFAEACDKTGGYARGNISTAIKTL